MDINCVAWAPDCTLIASASDDETVKLWVLEESQLWPPEWPLEKRRYLRESDGVDNSASLLWECSRARLLIKVTSGQDK